MSGDHSERAELVRSLHATQLLFQQRALELLTGPLVSTPLTMQQLKVLTLIAVDQSRATARDLAAELGVSLATMSGILDRLQDHDMIDRVADPRDRRIRRLVITPGGRDAYRVLLGASDSIPTAVLDRVPLDDLRALVRGLIALDRASEPDPPSS